jgi:hypothetical protein
MGTLLLLLVFHSLQSPSMLSVFNHYCAASRHNHNPPSIHMEQGPFNPTISLDMTASLTSAIADLPSLDTSAGPAQLEGTASSRNDLVLKGGRGRAG